MLPIAAPASASPLDTFKPSDSPAPAAATTQLTATKTDALLVDNDHNGKADPGDSLRYTVAVTNTSTTDASGLIISDTLDTNTSLVAGSARVSALAFADSYSTLVNTPLSIAAPGLLSNDTGTPAPTVSAATKATAAGGSVTLNANGSFSYTPPNNYSGTDSFTYTASNSAGSDSAKVTITVESAPRVVSTTPANSATAVPANSSITITFSESVKVTASAFTIECPSGTPVAFTNSTGSGPATSFTLVPSSNLPLTSVCKVTVAANQVSDADTIDPPDHMATDYSFSFTTTDAAPTVTGTLPLSGTTNVAPSSTIVITFSESVNVTASAFEIECPSGTAIPFSASSGPANVFTLTPSGNLPEGAICRISVRAAEVSDVDTVDPPDHMAADYSFGFVVEGPPHVSATTPANNATDVALNANITITFDESVSVTSSAFVLECPSGTPISFSVSPSSGAHTAFTLTPSSSLPVGTICTVTVTGSQVSDADTIDPPDTMTADYSFSFTTADTAPTVTSTSPANSATGVAIDSTIAITFSESVNVTASAFALECPTGTPVAFSTSPSSGAATSFTLTPSSDLPAGVTCTMTVAASQVSDVDTIDPPDHMAADYSFSFSTDAAPAVTSTSPANSATDVAIGSTIAITFSESVTAPASAFALECPTGTAIPFSVSPSSGASTSFTLTPSSNLPIAVTCTVVVSASQVSDADANDPPDTMVADYSFSFTTADTAPTVTSTSPANSATGTAIDSTIAITFSESVTAPASAFALECPTGTAIPFSVSPSSGASTSFTLTPSSDLPDGVTCTVTVAASQVSDADTVDPPDHMAANYSFSFSTDAAPTVTGTSPANSATGVSIDSTIVITFSESVTAPASAFALECPAGTPATFSLSPSSGASSSFTLTPSSLPEGVTCSVTVSASQVSDADANDPPDHMAADYSFTFSTDTAPSITGTSPANGATGVAIDSTIAITFSESVTAPASAFALECPAGTPIGFSISPSSGAATSFTLTPSGDLPDGVTCTVTVAATQISDADTGDPPDHMAADYSFTFSTDAAPTVTSTSPANSASNVAVNSTIAITFSESVTAPASAFALECPAGTPIGFSLSPSGGAHTSFTLTPSSSLPEGVTCSVAVAASQVSDADANDPPDHMATDYSFSFGTDAAPTITGTLPVTGALDVQIDSTIAITFSESVNVTASAFAISCGGAPQSFSLSASPASSFTLTPDSYLPINTACTVSVTAAQVHDSDSGDPPDTMVADYSFDFTTVNDNAPTVTSTTPSNSATGISTSSAITVTFSENVTAPASAFTLECPAGTPIGFSISPSSGTASSFTLTPSSSLPEGVLCSVTVAASQISDADTIDPPDHMTANYSFTFTTDSSPFVTSTSPVSATNGVAINSTIAITFSESVNVTASAFALACPTGTPIAFSTSPSSGASSSFTLTPSSSLPAGVTCQVTVVASEVSDADTSDPPNTMLANYVFSFTTDAAPTVVSTVPVTGTASVASTTNITVTFSESVSYSAASFALACPTGTPVAFALASSSPGTVAVLDPTGSLPEGVTCTTTVVANQIHDVDTNDPPDTMVADYVFSFGVDAAPKVLSTVPVTGTTSVAATTNITVTFSESVNYSAASFTIACPTGTPVAFALASTSPGTVAVLNPTSNLPGGVVCTVTVLAAGISDVDTNDPPDTMTANYVFSFSLPPVASDDTYSPQIIGNVGVNTANSSNFNVLANDQGPGITISGFSATSTHGGDVTLNTSTGTFQYLPAPGYEGSDSFTYTISSSTGVATGTVSLDVSGMIWFVNNNAATNGDGRLSSPFDSLPNFVSGAADGTGDNIFLYESASAYAGPITLLNNQRLIGQDATSTLDTIAGVVVPADSLTLPTMNSANGTIATLTSSGNGINLGSNNTLWGLTVGNTSGDDIGGTSFGTLTVRDMSLSGTGRALNLSTGTLDASFASVSSSNGTNNINLDTIAGTLTMNGGTLSGATSTAFNVVGGTVSTTYAGSITQSNSAALVSVSGGHSSGTLAFQTGTLSASNGTGLQFDNADGIYAFNGTTTLNGGDAGIDILNGSSGTFTFSSSSSITSPSGTAFNVTGSNAAITYNGTVAKTSAGLLVNMQGRASGTATLAGSLTCNTSCTGINVASNTGGSISFSGASKSISTGTNTAVTLSSNTGTTIRFSNGGLAITTTSGNGFSASGGGTVEVIGSGNSVTSSTGTPVTISSTTIGSNGVTFQSVSANGAANGIVLSATGSGAFTVTGSGTTNASGGTIQNITNRGASFINAANISLSNISFTNVSTSNGADPTVASSGCGGIGTGSGGNASCNAAIHLDTVSNVTLTNMRINSSAQEGINGRQVTGLTLSNSRIENAGNEVRERGMQVQNLFGTALITNTVFLTNYENDLLILNGQSTALNLTIANSTFNTSTAGSGVAVATDNLGAITLTANNNTIDNNFSGGLLVTAEGSSIGATITNNTVTNNNDGIQVAQNFGTAATYDISSNTVSNNDTLGINAFLAATSTASGSMSGTIQNNNITIPAGAAGNGIQVYSGGAGTHTALVQGNTLNYSGIQYGMLLTAQEGSGQANFTVNNNTITMANSTSGDGVPFDAIRINGGSTSGPPADSSTVCTALSGNAVTAPSGLETGFAGIRLRQRFSTTFNLYRGVSGSSTPATMLQDNNPAANSWSATATTAINVVATPCALPLMAAGGEGPGAPTAQIGQTQVAAVATAAIERWAAAGLPAQQIERLRAVSFQVTDLAAGQLGNTLGTVVQLDRDAAGWGWFVDTAPGGDSAFADQVAATELHAAPGSPADGRIDLLTVVSHELGHVLGKDDIPTADQPHTLMADTLDSGVRRVPAASSLPSLLPAAVATTSKTVQATVGTLPAGKHVVLIFDVVIAKPLPAGVNKISNQARISANSIATVLTDDPATSSASDPTITPIDVMHKAYVPLVLNQGSADLAVTSVTLSPSKTSFQAGEPVVVTVVIKNVGTVAAEPFWVDMYLNPSKQPAFNVSWNSVCSLSPCFGIAWSVASGLAPGASVTLSSQVVPSGYSVWPGYFAAGTTDLYVLADSWNPSGPEVDSNRTNNLFHIAGLSVTGTNPSLSAQQPLQARPTLRTQ